MGFEAAQLRSFEALGGSPCLSWGSRTSNPAEEAFYFELGLSIGLLARPALKRKILFFARRLSRCLKASLAQLKSGASTRNPTAKQKLPFDFAPGRLFDSGNSTPRTNTGFLRTPVSSPQEPTPASWGPRFPALDKTHGSLLRSGWQPREQEQVTGNSPPCFPKAEDISPATATLSSSAAMR